MAKEFEYEDKVGKAMLAIPLNGIFDLTKNVAPERMARFIETVKYYIDHEWGWGDGWELEFNNDYTKIKKLRRWDTA